MKVTLPLPLPPEQALSHLSADERREWGAWVESYEQRIAATEAAHVRELRSAERAAFWFLGLGIVVGATFAWIVGVVR